MQMGVPANGHFVRDLLQVSSLLDEFVGFGKNIFITAVGAPSDVADDPWDAWGGKLHVADAGSWHAPWSQRLQAEWLQAFYRIAISKPFVDTICWEDLADYQGHYISHGGLCQNNLQPKLAYRELRNFRARLATSPDESSSQQRGEAPPNQKKKAQEPEQ